MRTPLLHETIREWCIKFGSLFAEELRHREPRRGSRWSLDEVCTTVDGVRHWLWRAVDEHGFVLDILLQRRRDTDAAKTFLISLLGEYDVPEMMYTDQLRSYGAAIQELPNLVNIDHQQVISTARCNNLVEQRAGVLMGVRSAQDNLIDLHDVKNGNNRDSSGGDEHRNFYVCMPASRTFTITREPAFPLSPGKAIRSEHSRRGLRSQEGWPELQATPRLRLPLTKLRQHNRCRWFRRVAPHLA
jgi:IS1 family transposase